MFNFINRNIIFKRAKNLKPKNWQVKSLPATANPSWLTVRGSTTSPKRFDSQMGTIRFAWSFSGESEKIKMLKRFSSAIVSIGMSHGYCGFIVVAGEAQNASIGTASSIWAWAFVSSGTAVARPATCTWSSWRTVC